MLSLKLHFLRTLGYAALYSVAMVTGTATLMAAFNGPGEAPGVHVERIAAKAAHCATAPGAARISDAGGYVDLCSRL
jgi:hypothetical protein